MGWRDRVPAYFGNEDLIFASDPMDEERAEKAIREAKAAGASRDDFEKEMVWHIPSQLPKSETRQRRGKRGRRRPVGGEQDVRGAPRRIARLRPAQIDDPPRDRGRGIDEGHRPGREPLETVEQQGIVRTSKHDGVGAPPAG